jgi:hypothetical protein
MNWNVKGSTVDNAKQSIEAAVSKIGLPSFAKFVWENDELCVQIDKAGKSEFRLCLMQQGDTVNIAETKRSISFMHKPFVSKVESVVGQIMAAVGAIKK